jgi:uncharacterized protein (TIRG00374 family)
MAMSGAILYLSLDRSSWEIFREADGRRLALSFFLVVLVWLFDAIKMFALTRAAGERISFALSMELVWINYFGAAITPMQSGGGPFQMYVMYKNDICVGKSVAITLARTILTMLILGFSIPLSLLVQQELPRIGWGMKGFIIYVIALIMIGWLCFVLSLLRPRIIKRWFGILFMGLKRLGLLRSARVNRLIRGASREIDAYNQNLWAFITTGRSYFLLGMLAALFQLITYLSVMPCLIWAIGLPVQYLDCLIMQALFLFLLYFIPTPGGSGVAEGGAALVFSLFAPWNVAGVLGVGWRFLTEYTGIFLGTIVIIKLVGWGIVNQIMARGGAGESGQETGGDGA